MSCALELIDVAASAFGARAEELHPEKGIFALPLVLPDGSVTHYRLEVVAKSRGVTVREVVPDHLPKFCPQRHINSDGTFCLFWAGAGSLEISSKEDATKWWGTVWKFLGLQARAIKKRRWPNNEEWAHGDAATHQHKAIEAASRLGSQFSLALAQSAISVEQKPKRRRSQGPTLQVLVNGCHVFSVWLNTGKVVNLKQRCFCGSSGLKRPARLRSCQHHAQDAAELALELKRWQVAEEAFWSAFKGQSCCGTCDCCALQINEQGGRSR